MQFQLVDRASQDRPTGQVKSGKVKSGQVKSGQVKSEHVKSVNVKSGQVKLRQVKSGQVKSSQDWSELTFFGPNNFCIENLFGPKMHLRMEFDSGVGPTCIGQLIGCT